MQSKSLLQHHSSKASILWSSAFFMVQLSLPYVTTGITVTLTIWLFVGKTLSLFFCRGLSWLSFQTQHCVRTTQRRGGAFPRSQAKCYFHRKPRDPWLPAAQTQREQAPARDAAEHKTMRTDFGAGWPRTTPVLPGPSSVTLDKWPHLSVPQGPHL